MAANVALTVYLYARCGVLLCALLCVQRLRGTIAAAQTGRGGEARGNALLAALGAPQHGMAQCMIVQRAPRAAGR